MHFWVLVCGLLATVGNVLLRPAPQPAPQPAPRPAPPILGRVPDFTLANRDGRTVRLGDLAGEAWIADFVFTRCTASCPVMSGKMAHLDRELAPPPRVRLVSFSVDPEHDTPAVLARYAASYAASPRWLFLTGSREHLHRLSRQGFKLGVDSRPASRGPGAEDILHSTRFVLVDGRASIRGYYDSLDPAALRRLRDDLEAVGRE